MALARLRLDFNQSGRRGAGIGSTTGASRGPVKRNGLSDGGFSGVTWTSRRRSKETVPATEYSDDGPRHTIF